MRSQTSDVFIFKLETTVLYWVFSYQEKSKTQNSLKVLVIRKSSKELTIAHLHIIMIWYVYTLGVHAVVQNMYCESVDTTFLKIVWKRKSSMVKFKLLRKLGVYLYDKYIKKKWSTSNLNECISLKYIRRQILKSLLYLHLMFHWEKTLLAVVTTVLL